MKAQLTSINAYRKIVEDGLLSERRLEVYKIIAEHGPVNCRQIIEIASKGRVTNTGAFSGRLSELYDRRVIQEHHVGICPYTGHETIFWEITDELPHPVQIKKTKLQTLQEELEDLRKENKFLRQCLGYEDAS